MRLRGWLGLGFGAYAVFALASLPASAVLPRALAGAPELRLGPVSGTIWAGQVDGAQLRGEALPALRWAVAPVALLRGRLGLDFALGASGEALSGQGRAELGLGGALRLSGTDLRLPAARVQPYLQLPGFELGGELSLHLDSLALDGPRIAGLAGVLTWHHARIASPYGQAGLGSQAVHLAGNAAGGIDGALTELEGPMDLKGEFHWQANGQYASEGSVRAALPPELANFFRLVGQPDGTGRIRFRYQGAYRP